MITWKSPAAEGIEDDGDPLGPLAEGRTREPKVIPENGGVTVLFPLLGTEQELDFYRAYEDRLAFMRGKSKTPGEGSANPRHMAVEDLVHKFIAGLRFGACFWRPQSARDPLPRDFEEFVSLVETRLGFITPLPEGYVEERRQIRERFDHLLGDSSDMDIWRYLHGAPTTSGRDIQQNKETN